MRWCWFWHYLSLNDQYLRLGSDPAGYVADERAKFAAQEEARGPRGGRYRLYGPLEDVHQAQIGDDFIMNRWSFGARRRGRYIRPK